jgi:hypothetical protein
MLAQARRQIGGGRVIMLVRRRFHILSAPGG